MFNGHCSFLILLFHICSAKKWGMATINMSKTHDYRQNDGAVGSRICTRNVTVLYYFSVASSNTITLII